MGNVHRMFIIYIYIEHWNPETRKTRNDFLVQVRNLVLPLSKRFRHMEERCTIFLWWLFHLPHRPSRAAPVAHKFVWPQRAPKVDPSLSESSSQLLTFSNLPKSSAHASSAWHHSHLWSHPLSGIFILTSVNDTSSPHARQHLCSSLHLTNPCA